MAEHWGGAVRRRLRFAARRQRCAAGRPPFPRRLRLGLRRRLAGDRPAVLGPCVAAARRRRDGIRADAAGAGQVARRPADHRVRRRLLGNAGLRRRFPQVLGGSVQHERPAQPKPVRLVGQCREAVGGGSGQDARWLAAAVHASFKRQLPTPGPSADQRGCATGPLQPPALRMKPAGPFKIARNVHETDRLLQPPALCTKPTSACNTICLVYATNRPLQPFNAFRHPVRALQAGSPLRCPR